MIYKLLDFTVKPFLKLLIILSFSLALYLPEVQHIESNINKVLVQQAIKLSSNFKINPYDALEVVSAVNLISNIQDVKASYLYAIIEKESSFNKHAVSDKGKAKCLMQVHPSSGFVVKTSDIEPCLIAGTNILLNFQDKFGNMQDATKAYYCGTNIKRKSCNKYLQDVQSKELKYKGWI